MSEEFSVCQFFHDDSYEYVRRFVSVAFLVALAVYVKYFSKL